MTPVFNLTSQRTSPVLASKARNMRSQQLGVGVISLRWPVLAAPEARAKRGLDVKMRDLRLVVNGPARLRIDRFEDILIDEGLGVDKAERAVGLALENPKVAVAAGVNGGRDCATAALDVN